MKNVTFKKRQFITKKSMLGIEKRRSDVTKTRINYKPNILDCLFFCDNELVREFFDYAKKGLLETPYHWKNKKRFNDGILFFSFRCFQNEHDRVIQETFISRIECLEEFNNFSYEHIGKRA